MIAASREPRTADTGQDGAASPPPLGFVRFALLAVVLVAPIVAHGCHRDDLDHEPAVAPTQRGENEPGRATIASPGP